MFDSKAVKPAQAAKEEKMAKSVTDEQFSVGERLALATKRWKAAVAAVPALKEQFRITLEAAEIEERNAKAELDAVSAEWSAVVEVLK